MIQVRTLEGVLGLNQHNDYLKISLDKNIKGLRGFLVKRVDTPDNINRIKKYNMLYWPLNKTESQSSQYSWNSVHYKYGIQPWFSDNRKQYDWDQGSKLVN